MDNFRKQIEEDIREYQEEYSYIPNIEKDEWAFNYWVLEKLFYEENELIEEKIVDYHDLGIDAYEIYDDTKEVYLIQNKYYNDKTKITAEYIKNDFLLRAITALENGTYTKSDELQSFFTKYKDSDDFTVYLQLFVTNNERVIAAEKYVREFNCNHPKYHAAIFYLDDIKEKYFGEVKQLKKSITVYIESVNKGTILNINSESYKLANVIDARYVFTPVVSVFRLYRDSIEKGYPIFDMNIREYLGNKGVNKNIYKTLLDTEDRKNFFYYNNGITIICDQMSKINQQSSNPDMNAVFSIDNPQIVNGCQTVNSIYEALKNIDPSNLEKEFKDTFVMLKILEIDRTKSDDEILYHNIVKYNNSQNAIDEKTFVANASEFKRVQVELERKGFLLLIKQSDKNLYAGKYRTISKLKKVNSERMKKFGFEEMSKVGEAYIPLEKLLQIINAFMSGGEVAYRNKNKMLKFNSSEYNTAVNFIKDSTTDIILDLYLLYKRAEKIKKDNPENRYPIPYYLIDGFAIYECSNRQKEMICGALSDNAKVERIVKLYSAVTKAYTKDYYNKYSFDYNKMIKQPVDYAMFDSERDTLSSVL